MIRLKQLLSEQLKRQKISPGTWETFITKFKQGDGLKYYEKRNKTQSSDDFLVWGDPPDGDIPGSGTVSYLQVTPNQGDESAIDIKLFTNLEEEDKFKSLFKRFEIEPTREGYNDLDGIDPNDVLFSFKGMPINREHGKLETGMIILMLLTQESMKRNRT